MCLDDETTIGNKPLGCEHPKTDKYAYSMLRRVFPTCQVEAIATYFEYFERENRILTSRIQELERKVGIPVAEEMED